MLHALECSASRETSLQGLTHNKSCMLHWTWGVKFQDHSRLTHFVKIVKDQRPSKSNNMQYTASLIQSC